MADHRSNPDTGLCRHLIPGANPFETMLVLDNHMGPTEMLVRCRRCARPWLLEMLDWQDELRLYRTRVADPATTAGLLRDLERGSCDLARASEEARHFSLSSERLAVLLLLNSRTAELCSVFTPPQNMVIPSSGWRDLPCDGAWIRRFFD